MSKKKEPFKPIESHNVGLYSCGPTVYDDAHIGNLRAYVFVDVLKRTLIEQGFEVRHVMNMTDVGHLSGDSDGGDDKMSKALKREELPLSKENMKIVGQKYAKRFLDDLKSLSVIIPDETPFASDHIEAMQGIIKILHDKGYVYKTSDGLYFDTEKFPDYGVLGSTCAVGQENVSRIEKNPEKKNQADFAVWKFTQTRNKHGNMPNGTEGVGWDFEPFGNGFPGWHIECSAMSREYLGQPFDIHTGGIDHVGTHHDGEIAQSSVAFDSPLANFWLHNEHLILPEGKMAKSEGNSITLSDLKDKGVHPIAFRYYLLQTHYRSPLSFSLDAILAAHTALERLVVSIALLPKSAKEEGDSSDSDFVTSLSDALVDDLDTPKAIASIHENLRSSPNTESIIEGLKKADNLLGLNLLSLADNIIVHNPETEVKELLQKRAEYKKNNNWDEADKIREKVKELGYSIVDQGERTLLMRPLSRLEII